MSHTVASLPVERAWITFWEMNKRAVAHLYACRHCRAEALCPVGRDLDANADAAGERLQIAQDAVRSARV